MTMPAFPLDLHYEMHGTGPMLLLIPGAPADAASMTALALALSDEFTTVTFDLRGTSRSPLGDGPDPASVETLGDDAVHLIAALGDEPAFVFGSGGGAIIALDLATRHPQLVRSVVAHEPFTQVQPSVLASLPDVDALRDGRVPVAIGLGATSEKGMPPEAGRALVDFFDAEPLVFPGDHDGPTRDPLGFAAVLREAFPLDAGAPARRSVPAS